MIRPARPADEAAIRACAEAAYQRYVAAIGRRPAPMDADYAAHIATGEAHVAVDDEGRVQGFIVFFEDDGAMQLENVAVSPAAAGQGIGKALIVFCETEARRQGLTRVSLYTNEKMTGNLKLYPHLGYREIARRTEHGFNRVFFEKRVD